VKKSLRFCTGDAALIRPEVADGLQHRLTGVFDVDDLLRKGVPLSAPFAVARGVSRQLLINLFDALAVLSHGFPFRHQSLSSRIKSASGP